MPIFLDLNKEDTRSIDEIIQNEMKNYDLKYDYVIEGNYIKIEFLTNELIEEKKCFKELEKRIKQDIPPESIEYYNNIEEGGSNKFINNLINLIAVSQGLTYKEILEKYDDVVKLSKDIL